MVPNVCLCASRRVKIQATQMGHGDKKQHHQKFRHKKTIRIRTRQSVHHVRDMPVSFPTETKTSVGLTQPFLFQHSTICCDVARFGRDDECAGCCHHIFQRKTIVSRQRSIRRKICPRDQSLRQVREQCKLGPPLQCTLRPSLVLIHKRAQSQ